MEFQSVGDRVKRLTEEHSGFTITIYIILFVILVIFAFEAFQTQSIIKWLSVILTLSLGLVIFLRDKSKKIKRQSKPE